MTFESGLICERWPLVMPDFRVTFHAERPKWEVGRIEHMADRIKPGIVVYDVGAEQGDFTALYRSWGADVVPVEPMPAMWPCLRQTWEANGFDPPSFWFSGFAADFCRDAERGMANGDWPPESEGEVVADPGFRHLAQQAHLYPCVTLDELSNHAPTPDVLTIDIEGAEWHALAGCRQILRDRDLLVYVSVHPPTMYAWYDRTPDDLHALMRESGYEGEQLPAHGEGEEFWFYERRSA